MRDTALFRAFIAHRRELLAFLNVRVRCPDTAEDLCQDIYLKLHGIDDPGAIANPRSYLFMIAANLAADALRKDARRALLLNAGKDAVPPVADSPTPEEELMARAEFDHLRRAFAELAPFTRQIFRASRRQNLTQREIAARFQVSLSTVEYHIRKGLDHLARAREAFNRQG